jgi:dihydrofolate reductase
MSRSFHTTAFLGMTVDGHIARIDGSVDYLPPPPSASTSSTDPIGASPSPRVPTIDEMLSRSDVLVLGRKTYEVALCLSSAGKLWVYGDVPMLVLTSRTRESFGLEVKANATLVKDIDDVLRILDEKGWKEVWVDGGATVRWFLERGLLDEMVLTTVPVVLGDGVSLFGGLKREVRCEIVAEEKMEGMVGVAYKVLQ